MKRYKIKLNGFKKPLEFNLPLINSKLRKSNIFLNIINYLFLSFVPLFLIGFSLVSLLNNGVSLELNLLNYLIISTSIFLILFISRLVLLGFKVLMDPSLFINVLFYALLSITASVVVSNPNPLNTFGSGNFRALSGLAVMSLLTTFYILSSYLLDSLRFRKFIKSLVIGFFIYLLVIFINPSLVSLSTSLVFITLFSIFYIFWSINSNKNKLLKLSVFTLILGLSLLRLSSLKTFFNEIYIILFVMLFVSVISLVLVGIYKRDLIKTSLLRIKNVGKLIRLRKYRILFRNTLIQLLIISPLVILLLLLILTSQKYGTFLIFNIVIERLVTTFKNFFELANGNLLAILSGFGFDGYRATYPLISNILYMQGLFGILAHFTLGSFVVFKLIKLLKDSKDYRLVIGMLVSVLFLIFYSLVSYPGLLSIVFSWLILILLSYLTQSKSLTEVKEVVKPLSIRNRLKNKYGVLLRFVILAILIALIVFGGISFINAIKLY